MLCMYGIGKAAAMVARIAPRVVVRLANGATEAGHMVGRTGYRTLCGQTLTSATCAGTALTCPRCAGVAARLYH